MSSTQAILAQGPNKIGVKSTTLTQRGLELKLFEILFCCWKKWGVPKLVLKPSLSLRKPYWFLMSNFLFLFAKFQGFISFDCGGDEDYIDEETGIPYKSDKDLIDTGIVKTVSPNHLKIFHSHKRTWESFPKEQGIVTPWDQSKAKTIIIWSGQDLYMGITMVKTRSQYLTYILESMNGQQWI